MTDRIQLQGFYGCVTCLTDVSRGAVARYTDESGNTQFCISTGSEWYRFTSETSPLLYSVLYKIHKLTEGNWQLDTEKDINEPELERIWIKKIHGNTWIIEDTDIAMHIANKLSKPKVPQDYTSLVNFGMF